MKEPPTSLDEARTLANVQERATRLYEDGYRARTIDCRLVEIHTPQGETYSLDVTALTCDCPFFRKASSKKQPGPDRTCKHLLGLTKLLAAQQKQAQELRIRRHNLTQWEALV